MAGRKRLSVHANPDKCRGHNRCKALAPELFRLDEYGNARQLGDGSVLPALEEKAHLARSNCPELADLLAFVRSIDDDTATFQSDTDLFLE